MTRITSSAWRRTWRATAFPSGSTDVAGLGKFAVGAARTALCRRTPKADFAPAAPWQDLELGTTQVLDVTDDRMPPEAFLTRLATVAPRETDAHGASPADPAEPPKRCLFLASFADDPVVEPYRDAVVALLNADFKDDWEISAQSMMTSASVLNDTIANCDFYLAGLGVFYGPALNGETTGLLGYTLKQAREQGRVGLACLVPPKVPQGISIEFLAEHGGAVKDLLALRRSVGADAGKLDVFEAGTSQPLSSAAAKPDAPAKQPKRPAKPAPTKKPAAPAKAKVAPKPKRKKTGEGE